MGTLRGIQVAYYFMDSTVASSQSNLLGCKTFALVVSTFSTNHWNWTVRRTYMYIASVNIPENVRATTLSRDFFGEVERRYMPRR